LVKKKIRHKQRIAAAKSFRKKPIIILHQKEANAKNKTTPPEKEALLSDSPQTRYEPPVTVILPQGRGNNGYVVNKKILKEEKRAQLADCKGKSNRLSKEKA
jgi:hypothetical protein